MNNMLCTMIGYYHDKIFHDTKMLFHLEKDILQDILTYRVNKPTSYVSIGPDFINRTVPIRANLIMLDNNMSTQGFVMMRDDENNLVFPGGYIDEWTDMYDYNNLYTDGDLERIIYRAIIRGLCYDFAKIDDCSSFNMNTLEDCAEVLRDVLYRYIHVSGDIIIRDVMYYWYGEEMNVCLVCQCDYINNHMLEFLPRVSVQIGTGYSNFIKAVTNTPKVFIK